MNSAEQPQHSFIFRDTDDELYVVPVDLLTQYRVPTENKSELEQRLAESASAEVTGYEVGMSAVQAIQLGLTLLGHGDSGLGGALLAGGLKALPQGADVLLK